MAAATTDAPEFDFLLAGTWWSIPVNDPEETDRAIRRIVEDAAGRSDELATLRRLTRERLSETVADARRIEAEHLYLAREISPGLPLSASLAVYRPALDPLPEDVAASPKLARAFVKAALAEADGPGAGIEARELDLGSGAVLRRSWIVERTLQEGADPVRSLRADYWMPIPGTRGFLLLSFTSLFVPLADKLLEFFDAVVGTVRWRDRAA